jgi:formylglycine-generating enzyme required for sulfatase activity/serine/threonine protein kinase
VTLSQNSPGEDELMGDRQFAVRGGAGMNGESNDDSSLIDLVADRFERAWLAGDGPRIEDYLAGTVGARRSRLFTELFQVERELRAREGVLPTIDEYRRRFPDLVEVIHRALAGPTDPLATVVCQGDEPTTAQDDSPRDHAVVSEPAAAMSRDERFRFLHHHADGGIGRVSVALDCELQRHVAVKELQDRFADDPQVRQRFLLEVHVTGRLEHPGVVPVYSLGRDGRGRPFYAMRFIEGEDLERAIKSFHAADSHPGRDPGKRALAMRQLLRRFVDVCNVVAYAHSRGVLHRDLKPANILLGPYGETLVVDWGMAKVVDGTLAPIEVAEQPGGCPADGAWDKTQQGTILGTIPYMSPEQAEGEAPGACSDVYSLGATLYHLISGRPPIEKCESFEMLRRVRDGEIASPRQVNARVPAALEAVCRKAMSGRPADRYASPRALANEIEHWLADEPVSAWKEPWRVRSRRWILRHRTPVSAAAAALAVTVVALLHLLNDYHLRRVETRARAEGLVVALSTAEVRAVADIIRQLHPIRWLVNEKLEAMARPGPVQQGTKRRNAALALLADNPAHTEYLVNQIVREDVHPHEICVVRQALLEHDQARHFVPRLWQVVAERPVSSPPNLGAAGALASFSREDPRWAALAEPIAAELVSKSPTSIGEWREVFQPVERSLVPPLRAIFGDVGRPRERALAFSLLLDFAVSPGNTRRDQDLAELVADANPDEFLAIRHALEDRARMAAVLLAKLDQREPPNEATARRRGRLAACLIVLGWPDPAWPLLSGLSSGDPGDRTELIHDLAAYGVAASDVAARFAIEPDASSRRALILALGEYSPAAVPQPVRRTVEVLLRKRYATDPDPGTHSAIDWLFRTKWGIGQQLDSLDESWRGKALADGRRWFVNSEGVTMTVIPVIQPIEFQIGSPDDEDGRESDERIHAVRLNRSYAVATREVNLVQFERFLDSGARSGRPNKGIAASSSALCPVVGVDWLDAVGYCNWLSRRENLQPYYAVDGDIISVPDPGGLGYRLPSELEWEYACRAGTRSARPQGSSPAFLENFAWFLLNANRRTHPVGTRKPNDLGLFDMLGNAFEWTGDRYTRDSAFATPGSAAARTKPPAVSKDVEVVLRGGSFTSPATSLRSAYREYSPPSDPLETYGFRYVRSIPMDGEHQAESR